MTKDDWIAEANKPKHRLIEIARTLEELPGCKSLVSDLERIIARLETWQRKHGRG